MSSHPTRSTLNLEFGLAGWTIRIATISVDLRSKHLLTEFVSISAHKRYVFLKTDENVRRYLGSFLKTRYPCNSTYLLCIPFNKTSGEPYSKCFHNVDIVISFLRMNKSKPAWIASTRIQYPRYDRKNLYPEEAAISVHTDGIPDVPQDHNSQDNRFFLAICHEYIHIFALEPSLYKGWIDSATGEPYISPPRRPFDCANNTTNKCHLLSTPDLEDLAAEKFGTTDFFGLGQAGIVLSDKAHPHFGLYRRDLTTNALTPESQLTELTGDHE
jgi:hypothetical protein